MLDSTIAISGDQAAGLSKLSWEDPCITLERDLEVRAQSRPPTGGAPEFGPLNGFLAPMGTSGGTGQCT
jgi:hypothetical protein